MEYPAFKYSCTPTEYVNMLLTGWFFISDVCTPDFLTLWGQFKSAQKTCTQAWTWETQLKYRTLFSFFLRIEDEIKTGITDSHPN